MPFSRYVPVYRRQGLSRLVPIEPALRERQDMFPDLFLLYIVHGGEHPEPVQVTFYDLFARLRDNGLFQEEPYVRLAAFTAKQVEREGNAKPPVFSINS
jgi:hypothetical protein